MKGLTAKRIEAVVKAHRLDRDQADAAASATQHIIDMFIEWHMPAESVACVLELLTHLRLDRASSGSARDPFEIFTDAIAEMGSNGITKSDLIPIFLDFTAATAIALGGEEALVNCMIRIGDRIKDYRDGTFPVAE